MLVYSLYVININVTIFPIPIQLLFINTFAICFNFVFFNISSFVKRDNISHVVWGASVGLFNSRGKLVHSVNLTTVKSATAEKPNLGEANLTFEMDKQRQCHHKNFPRNTSQAFVFPIFGLSKAYCRSLRKGTYLKIFDTLGLTCMISICSRLRTKHFFLAISNQDT